MFVMTDAKKELLNILLTKSIKTVHFILASGKESDLYCDCRITALDARGANLIGQVGWELVQEEIMPKFPNVKAIGGMTMGADPISLAIGMYSVEGEEPLKAVTVRKEAKDHGRGKRIEGNFEAGQEIIVVDDGSSDNIKEILTDYCTRYPNVKAIYQENGGVTPARLRGVTEATGDRSGFMDADDYVEPQTYARLLGNALEADADISHCGHQILFSDGRIE